MLIEWSGRKLVKKAVRKIKNSGGGIYQSYPAPDAFKIHFIYAFAF